MATAIATDLGPPSQVMDGLLLSLARKKAVSDSQIIRAIEGAQTSYNKLDKLYTDVKELHKTHTRNKKRSGSMNLQLLPAAKRPKNK